MIETPPEGRRPVKTYVGDYDDDLVAKAIKRELARGGQAFFLHNRVETIDETAERVRALVPDARVLVAHGQMAEGSSRMLEFLRGDADVLVCTTIVESGLDIPSANTLIVERADELGSPSSTRSAAASGARASAPTPTCSTRRPPRCRRRPASGWPRSPTTRSSAPASRSPCATSRSAARATCSATSSPGTWRPWASSSTSG